MKEGEWMGLFGKSKRVQRGTGRWRELHACLDKFATDFWRYLALIDGAEWDRRAIQMQVAAIESDLTLAGRIWPEGKSTFDQMGRLFATMVRIREDERAIVVEGKEQRTDFSDFEKWQRESTLRSQRMNEVMKKLESLSGPMRACTDEIKKWTSIDVQSMLDTLPTAEKLGLG
jgi:hypothetical protein